LLEKQDLPISSQALKEGRSRDYPKGVQPSGWKREATHVVEDIVRSVQLNVQLLNCGSELTNLDEHNVTP